MLSSGHGARLFTIAIVNAGQRQVIAPGLGDFAFNPNDMDAFPRPGFDQMYNPYKRA